MRGFDMAMTITLILLLAAIMGFSWLNGGSPERRVVAIVLLAYFMSIARMLFVGIDNHDIDNIGFFIDIITFSLLLHTAIYAWRVWTIWAASLQLLPVFAHFVRILEIDMDPLAYGLMRASPTYFVWIALLIGVASHGWRIRTGINIPSWRNWSAPSSRTRQAR
jgi:hypothetical protein